ncbi:nucleotide-binding protein [Paenibacillus sp. MZ04-78.2]|uniref:nucleotide-binding protein n=1 Tax=Paenibacillus sp. MZ04-78.2 TaxID=2962034 RepID=UPI0020B7388E|nr:nucleotide-binding protein [Paenibacillus sp. MZ04-78.2]MCP3776017.1 nucleotide-binding protein [Paenibacillus sp. MZ04-78.2]
MRKIFIGGSLESGERVMELARIIEAEGEEPVPWDKPGLFPLGGYTLEQLIKISRTVDGALFVFGEDDKVWYRNDMVYQPRDNVFIEFGIFAGQIGPERTVIAVSGNVKAATDLRGVITCNLDRPYQARIQLRQWLNGLALVRNEAGV